jgi:hypothetical protein
VSHVLIPVRNQHTAMHPAAPNHLKASCQQFAAGRVMLCVLMQVLMHAAVLERQQGSL